MTTQYTQLEFFEPSFETCINVRMKTVEEKQEKYRRCQFGKIGKCENRITSIEDKLDILIRGICQGTATYQNFESEIERSSRLEALVNQLEKRLSNLERESRAEKILETTCEFLSVAVM